MLVIRPQKEFTASNGRSRLVGLRLLTELRNYQQDPVPEPPHASSASEPRNAYDFMKRRRENDNLDPNVLQWNAAIRMENFANLSSSPLCVGAFSDNVLGI